MHEQARAQRLLRAILAFSIVSTGLHYTHNFVAIEDYPQASWVSNTAVRVAIVLFWPLATALAVVAYRAYARGRIRAASAMLAVYALIGLSTLGHFTAGTPDIPPFWFATIFTDGLAGLAVLSFAIWSELSASPAPDAA